MSLSTITPLHFFIHILFMPSFFLNLEIEIRTKFYKTTDHPDVATTLGNIAAQWSNMGLYEKALQQFEKVLGK